MAAPVTTGGAGGVGFAPAGDGAGGGVTGISSAAPAFTGVPGAYFCNAPETRAALSAWTRISCPWVNRLSLDGERWGRRRLQAFDLDLLHEAA